jgi:hybrid cluster-associated redox disulfide protein
MSLVNDSNEGGMYMKATKDMTIGEIINQNPNAARILMGMGLGCVSCPASQAETLEEAAQVHGLDIEKMLSELNNEA